MIGQLQGQLLGKRTGAFGFATARWFIRGGRAAQNKALGAKPGPARRYALVEVRWSDAGAGIVAREKDVDADEFQAEGVQFSAGGGQ